MENIRVKITYKTGRYVPTNENTEIVIYYPGKIKPIALKDTPLGVASCDFYSPISWKSQDPSIAKVTEDGRVYGVKVGTTMAVGTVKWSGQVLKVPVTVTKNEYVNKWKLKGVNASVTMHYTKKGDLVYDLYVNNKKSKKLKVQYKRITLGIIDKKNKINAVTKKKKYNKFSNVTVGAKSKKTIRLATVKAAKMKNKRYDLTYYTSWSRYKYWVNEKKSILRYGYAVTCGLNDSVHCDFLASV